MATNSKRQAIVDTATRLFTQHGYHAVGTDRIIEEAGVAKMTLFRNFPTKNDLISEVLTQRAHSALTSISSSIATRSTPIERLQEVFAWHDRWFKARDFSGCMFTSALSEFHSESGEIIRISTTQKIQLRLFIQSLLLDLVPPAMIEPTARQIVMLLDGATLSAVVGDKEHAADDAWQATERLLWTASQTSAAPGTGTRKKA
ncbi:TetR family regulatory protein [Burkholderia lata]|uniref:TetR family regulatory protein n=1 Tax=Burkholderia lata (strain ATCC 17760 / DSM 23089 / LMG 22485 / NCIMB 9086 / R18194 / 383) TaxID=482957 RepID=A0A6P2XBE7_BURL3|nr:TetR/AcrR family transcriptional regulator [Burkholderia lata]VWD05489.1 TetR family regulatory protein [Burkholderia lata]